MIGLVLDMDAEDVDEDDRLSKRDADRYLSLIARRAAGAPFPVLMGRIEFYGLELQVWPGAFVPRPSSELLVDRAVRRLRRLDDPVVVDVCTGAGPIALAIADEISDATVARDRYPGGGSGSGPQERAGARHRERDVQEGGHVQRFAGGSAWACGRHHRPTSPTCRSSELDDLPAEVRDHEPLYTLTDESDDGLYLMRRAILEAPRLAQTRRLAASRDLRRPDPETAGSVQGSGPREQGCGLG